MKGNGSRRSKAFRPSGEPMERRQLLSTLGNSALFQIFHNPKGFAASRPDTPVLPYAARSTKATFIDPSALIVNGNHVVVGGRSYIAPYVQLNATSGFIKIGST